MSEDTTMKDFLPLLYDYEFYTTLIMPVYTAKRQSIRPFILVFRLLCKNSLTLMFWTSHQNFSFLSMSSRWEDVFRSFFNVLNTDLCLHSFLPSNAEKWLKWHNFVIFRYISTKLGAKVYILVFNSCEKCHIKIGTHCWYVNKSQRWGYFFIFTL